MRICIIFSKEPREEAFLMQQQDSKANNPDCPDYDPTKETKYINYIDMNNLYGYVMRDFLPYRGLEFIEVTDDTIKEASTTIRTNRD